MKYDLALPRQKFEEADRVVRSVLLRSGRMELKALNLITSDSSQLHPDDRFYIEEHPESLGVCFGQGNLFDIYVSPSFTHTGNAYYMDTILHELCHGYLVQYNHNQRWKRFFGRVLFHYFSLVQPYQANVLVEKMLRRYTNQGEEPWGRYIENIWTELRVIEDLALQEAYEVSKLYKRITNKERPYAKGVDSLGRGLADVRRAHRTGRGQL